MSQIDKLYSDRNREEKSLDDKLNKYSKYCDLIYYRSSVTPGIKLAMLIYKPEKPSYILATTHGWHMSIPKYEENNDKPSDYLRVMVDMRGRAFSEGKQDCNGLELFDVYDAIEYVKIHYKDYIIDDEIIYYEGGSGAGGNALALASKFPDYFAAISALCGISDYALWFNNDKVGEFKDEMFPWIGCSPDENPEAYRSRSGIDSITNLRSPMFIAHGHDDIRVPCYHSSNYYKKSQELGYGDKVKYWEVPNAGGIDHWTNITEENAKRIDDLSEENRVKNRKPIILEKKGNLIIPGFLVTKYFIVLLDDINSVATISYDIEKDIYEINSKVNYKIIKK